MLIVVNESDIDWKIETDRHGVEVHSGSYVGDALPSTIEAVGLVRDDESKLILEHNSTVVGGRPIHLFMGSHTKGFFRKKKISYILHVYIGIEVHEDEVQWYSEEEMAEFGDDIDRVGMIQTDRSWEALEAINLRLRGGGVISMLSRDNDDDLRYFFTTHTGSAGKCACVVGVQQAV